MPQYQSSASFGPFHAASQKQAVTVATQKLADEAGGNAKLVSVEHDGDHSACVATITTESKIWEDGQQVLKPSTETRRFVVKPQTY